MIRNILIVLGAILVLISFIGFLPVMQEELYWQQVGQYEWTIATRAVWDHPFAIEGLIICIIGAFFLLASNFVYTLKNKVKDSQRC